MPKTYNLLRSEQSVAGRQLPSMESVTFYKGVAPIRKLRERVEEIIHCNPFLVGRFHLPNEKGAHIQFKVPCTDAGTLYALNLDDHFRVYENVAISADDEFSVICNTVGKLPNLSVPNAAECLASYGAVFRVAILQHPSRTQFALYFALCHGIGDGHCYYSLYNMLNISVSPYRMVFDRVKSYQNDVWDLLPDVAADLRKDENMGLPVFGSLVGIVACVLAATVRDTLVSLVYGKSAWGIAEGPSPEWIQEQKAQASRKSGFVSTNDCFVSWFLTKTQCDYGSMAVNTRNLVQNVTNVHFGNYLTV
ncbi:hypothetical protein HDU99_006606, partial [Rhizoclosmatium hyalinum]